MAVLVLISCKDQSIGFKTINEVVLKDKIAGGWAGKDHKDDLNNNLLCVLFCFLAYLAFKLK